MSFHVQFNSTSGRFDTEFDSLQVIITGDSEYYDGEYQVTPDTEAQTLATSNKLMRENITVRAIPYHEATNDSGGITVTIGAITE